MRSESHPNHTVRPPVVRATPGIRHYYLRGTVNHNETLIRATPVIRHGVIVNHNETLIHSTPVIRHGFIIANHNETLIRSAPVIRHGGHMNHNETLIRATPVIRHGANLSNHNETLIRTTPVIRHGLNGMNHNETLVGVTPVRSTVDELSAVAALAAVRRAAIRLQAARVTRGMIRDLVAVPQTTAPRRTPLFARLDALQERYAQLGGDPAVLVR